MEREIDRCIVGCVDGWMDVGDEGVVGDGGFGDEMVFLCAAAAVLISSPLRPCVSATSCTGTRR